MAGQMMQKYFDFIEAHQDEYVALLKEAVAIPSVSGICSYRENVVEMGLWLEKKLKDLGVKTRLAHLGKQQLQGESIDLPPVVLGELGTCADKNTILVYGHYDVQPAKRTDGWASEPFALEEAADGKLVGRGSTDDKGPILGWLVCIEAHQRLGIELPVNLRFCFEGMEESGSVGLDALIEQEARGWFAGTDAVCISDNYWLGRDKPCLTYGLRGVSYFHVEITGPKADLHSGVFGGAIHEPMNDLVRVLGTLVDSEGKIRVPHLYDDVQPCTDDEDKTFDTLSFKNNDMIEDLGRDVLLHGSEKDTLKSRWRYPSLSLHGVEGGFYEPGDKTVIPSKVTGKFSIRTVPNMQLERVTELVVQHLNSEFAKLGSKSSINAFCSHAGPWWYSSPKHPNFTAAAKAVEETFGVSPDLTREGGSIPVTIAFQDALDRNVLLLPMGAADDGAHSINEKLDRKNYIQGIKLFGSYLHHVSAAKLH